MSPESLPNAIRALVGEEARRRSVYADSRGYSTIGVGRLVDARFNAGLSDDEMDYLLANDIASAEAEVAKAFPWAAKLNDARQFVLVSMVFQLGLPRLQGFKRMLAAMQAEKWYEARLELFDSDFHKQTPARCERLGKQLLMGEWVYKPGT